MASVLDLALAAIVGLLAVIIVSTMYASINMEELETTVRALIILVPTILAAGILIRMVLGAFS